MGKSYVGEDGVLTFPVPQVDDDVESLAGVRFVAEREFDGSARVGARYAYAEDADGPLWKDATFLVSPDEAVVCALKLLRIVEPWVKAAWADDIAAAVAHDPRETGGERMRETSMRASRRYGTAGSGITRRSPLPFGKQWGK